MTENFHINKDVDCLYIPRSEGGRGLKTIQTAYECGIVSVNHHLRRNKDRNQLLSIYVNPKRMKVGELQMSCAVNMT